MIKIELSELRHIIAKEMKLLSEDDEYSIGIGQVYPVPNKATVKGIKHELRKLMECGKIVRDCVGQLEILLTTEEDPATLKELEEMLEALKPLTASFVAARYHGSKILEPHRIG